MHLASTLTRLASLELPSTAVRAIVWVNEENGSRGGQQYAADYGAPPGGNGGLANHSWVLETDIGAWQPWGIGVSCGAGDCSAAIAQLSLLGAALLAPIGSGNVSAGGGGTDIEPSCELGVPCVGVNVLDPRLTPDSNNPCTSDAMGAWGVPALTNPANVGYDSFYFWNHHSESDTIERMDARQLNHHAAALAVWAYAVAQLPTLLPRNASAPAPPAPPPPPAAALVSAGTVIAGVAGAAAVAAAGLLAWRRRSDIGRCSARIRGGGTSAPSTIGAGMGAAPYRSLYAASNSN